MSIKYRKKPLVIEAVQFITGAIVPSEFSFAVSYRKKMSGVYAYVETLEGEMMISEGDWIIKGIHGEFYPVKDEIFRKSYEKVEE